jgi:hypothetical protein
MSNTPTTLQPRQYQRLLVKAVRRIPAHSPVWTDHRQSDPGVTMVQLFAWVAESLGVRPDKLPISGRLRMRRAAAHLRRNSGPPRLLVTGGTRRTRHAAIGFIADALGLALARVDFSGVKRKYIGETEKNLDRQIAVADPAAIILLFDEADALFGRRSAVRDSHDRYANQALSHLWQRAERYEGLVILTTNRLPRRGARRWRGLRLDLSRPGRRPMRGANRFRACRSSGNR